jgi:uncharacterized protein (DUF1330 family)
MSAFMIIYMSISDDSWMASYFASVAGLLEEHGAVMVGASQHVERIEGSMPTPDRMAVLRFPSVEAIKRFMADSRYQVHRDARQRGADAEIFIFESAVTSGELA